MKKFILGILVGAILFVPMGVYAADKVSVIPTANMIYTIPQDYKQATVSVFDDQDVKCYVASPPAYRDTKPSISCVRGLQND